MVFLICHPFYMPKGELRVQDLDGYTILVGQLGYAVFEFKPSLAIDADRNYRHRYPFLKEKHDTLD